MNGSSPNMETITEIKEILIKQNLWLSAAESLTCGKLQSSIGEVSGISKCFKGGITAYSIDEKVNFLNVIRAHAEVVNCVSQPIANQMAKGVSLMFNSEIGIATTGYAESYEDDLGHLFEPHAFYSIYIKDGNSAGVIIEGKVIPEGKNRVAFQDFIVATLFTRLLGLLKND